jgi:plasmid stability protein
MKEITARAKANSRSTEAEVREILADTAQQSEHKRVKFGSELVAAGKLLGAIELEITRDQSPFEPADFT